MQIECLVAAVYKIALILFLLFALQACSSRSRQATYDPPVSLPEARPAAHRFVDKVETGSSLAAPNLSAPLVASGGEADPIPKRDFKVGTYNLAGETNVDKLFDSLSKDKNDVYLLQEVKGWTKDSNAACELAKRMNYYCRATKRRGDSEGIAILSRFPIKTYDEKEYTNIEEEEGGKRILRKAQTSRLLLGFNRIATSATLDVPGMGPVRVSNVHLTNWGFEEHIRRRQAKLTMEWISDLEKKHPTNQTFLGGDFNADLGSPTLNEILKPEGVGGIVLRNDNQSQTPSHGNHRIDYIFSGQGLANPSNSSLFFADRPALRFVNEYVNQQKHSDHQSVSHEYRIEGNANAGPNLTSSPANPDATPFYFGQ